MLELLFWLSAATIAYVYVGYPLVLTALARLFPRPVKKGPFEPFVSLLVPAYNEGGVIAAKIESALKLDYPKERLEIVIASDGSSDDTVSRARAYEDGKLVRVFAFEQNRGKLQALNEVVPQLRGEIVAFSDASSMLRPSSIRELAAHFADPQVGAVSGVYRVLKKDEAELGRQEGFYWKYETYLKRCEAAIGSMLA